MANVKKRIGKNGALSYYIQVFIGVDVNGKQITKGTTWRPPAGMKESAADKHAQKEAVLFEEKVKIGAVTIDGNMKFADYAARWLENSDFRPNTRKGEEIRLKNINQAIGHIPLNKLRVEHLQQFYKNLREEGTRRRNAAGFSENLKARMEDAGIRYIDLVNTKCCGSTTIWSAMHGKRVSKGRATVLNLVVISLLIAASYFAMFYTPLTAVPALMRYAERPMDYAYSYRVDETEMPSQNDIEQMAAENDVHIQDFQETEAIVLATDGYSRYWTDEGKLNNEYEPFWREGLFLSESHYNAISGQNVNIEPGKYAFITRSDYTPNVFDYYQEMTLFTNPDTRQTLKVSMQEVLTDEMTHRYILLDDADYAAISAGLTDEWRERWVQFNVEDVKASYPFATELYNALVDASGAQSLHSISYDRIGQLLEDEGGESYFLADEPLMNKDARNSFEFVDNWRFMPQFRVLDQMNFVSTVAVFLVLFIFISIICLTAVIVIAYTRCITIANSNMQVYDDLRHLGAKRDYLRRSVKSQVSKVYAIPAMIGTVAVFGFFTLIMYANTGAFEHSEIVALGINAALVAVVSLLLYGVYRITLRKVCMKLSV